MIKKLQNLLFEDEEDIETEEELVDTNKTESAPVASQPVVTPNEKKEEESPIVLFEEEPVVEPSKVEEKKEEVVEEIKEEVKPVEEKKAEFGIIADDVKKEVEVKPVVKPTVKPKNNEVVSEAVKYNFRPVISPIFGVDEKDINSLKNTTNKINANKKAKNDANISPIISPMYGSGLVKDKEEEAREVEEENTNVLMSAINEKENVVEDEIPEFSLDDILKVREEEFSAPVREVEEDSVETPAFPEFNFDDEELDTKEEENNEVVMPSFDEDDSEINLDEVSELEKKDENTDIDNTAIIKNQLFDDDDE